MDELQRTEIIDYLCGPRDHYAGSVLYAKYGPNLRLKNLFAVDDSRTSHQMMIYELHKLANVTQAEIDLLPKTAAKPKQPGIATSQAEQPGIAVHGAEKPGKSQPVSTLPPAPPAVQQQARLRDAYPFLNNPDCPDELKVAVADMLSAHSRYVDAHAELQTKGDGYDEEAARLTQTIVEAYLTNRQARALLEQYRNTGQLPDTPASQPRGEAEDPEDITTLTDLELIGKHDSARVQVSKLKSKIAKAAAKGADTAKFEVNMNSWLMKQQTYMNELNRRRSS